MCSGQTIQGKSQSDRRFIKSSVMFKKLPSKVRSNNHTASRYPRFRPFPNETCDRSVRVYSHGFLFVLAVNRIACAGRACAGRAPVSSRAPRRVAMPTTWERTHHANPDARQRQHHTPTLRSLEPYYYYLHIYIKYDYGPIMLRR